MEAVDRVFTPTVTGVIEPLLNTKKVKVEPLELEESCKTCPINNPELSNELIVAFVAGAVASALLMTYFSKPKIDS